MRFGTVLLPVIAPFFVVPAGVSTAHTAPPGMHAVKYIISSDVPAAAEIHYRDTDPTDFADYSHDPYRYSPKVEADIAPGASWQLEVALATPDQWAMVAVSSASSSAKAEFLCVLLVDGAIAARNQGRKGTLCSLRQW
jgi:hypothetical protein